MERDSTSFEYAKARGGEEAGEKLQEIQPELGCSGLTQAAPASAVPFWNQQTIALPGLGSPTGHKDGRVKLFITREMWHLNSTLASISGPSGLKVPSFVVKMRRAPSQQRLPGTKFSFSFSVTSFPLWAQRGMRRTRERPLLMRKKAGKSKCFFLAGCHFSRQDYQEADGRNPVSVEQFFSETRAREGEDQGLWIRDAAEQSRRRLEKLPPPSRCTKPGRSLLYGSGGWQSHGLPRLPGDRGVQE